MFENVENVSWIICQCWRLAEVWIKVEVGDGVSERVGEGQERVRVSGRDGRQVR